MLGKHSGVLFLFLVAFMLETAGCSSGPVIPKTVAVRGKVVYKDQPLADAEIGFVGKLDNKDVLAARGTTNSAGEFTLSTYIDPQHEVSGSTPGEYAVTLTINTTINAALAIKRRCRFEAIIGTASGSNLPA